MEELLGHEHPQAPTGVRVYRVDERNEHGVAHDYSIEYMTPEGLRALTIHFQDGPFADGANGITDLALLSVLIDRFEGYLTGDIPHVTTNLVYDQLLSARFRMLGRITDRVERGVQGTYEK